MVYLGSVRFGSDRLDYAVIVVYARCLPPPTRPPALGLSLDSVRPVPISRAPCLICRFFRERADKSELWGQQLVRWSEATPVHGEGAASARRGSCHGRGHR